MVANVDRFPNFLVFTFSGRDKFALYSNAAGLLDATASDMSAMTIILSYEYFKFKIKTLK